MARGTLFPAGLKVLIAVLALLRAASSADDSRHHCAPSSCGNIRNISDPFRLESDPVDCGDQRYNLGCENNHSVLYLHSRKYYVQEINYTDYTIRVVESSIQERNGTFISPYSLVQPNFTSEDPYTLSYPHNVRISCGYSSFQFAVVLVNCKKPATSQGYWDTSTCFDNGVYFSNSSASHPRIHQYLLVDPTLEDLEDLCQVEQISWRWGQGHFPSTCTEFYDQLAQGFKLSWAQARCNNFAVGGDCVLEGPKSHDWCRLFENEGSPQALYWKVQVRTLQGNYRCGKREQITTIIYVAEP